MCIHNHRKKISSQYLGRLVFKATPTKSNVIKKTKNKTKAMIKEEQG